MSQEWEEYQSLKAQDTPTDGKSMYDEYKAMTSQPLPKLQMMAAHKNPTNPYVGKRFPVITPDDTTNVAPTLSEAILRDANKLLGGQLTPEDKHSPTANIPTPIGTTGLTIGREGRNAARSVARLALTAIPGTVESLLHPIESAKAIGQAYQNMVAANDPSNPNYAQAREAINQDLAGHMAAVAAPFGIVKGGADLIGSLRGAPKAPLSPAEAMAEKVGAKYDGVQEMPNGKAPIHQFTDHETGTTVLVKNIEDLPAKLEAKRVEFAKKQPEPIAEPQLQLLNAGLTPENLRQAVQSVTPDFLKQIKNRVTTPEGKQVIAGIDKAAEIGGQKEGTWLQELEDTGLRKIKDADAPAVADKIEAGQAPEIASILENIRNEAVRVGVLKPGQNIQNYFPRLMKREIAEKVYDDLDAVIGEMKNNPSISDQSVAAALEKKSAETKNIIGHLIETGQAKGYIDAVRGLYHASAHDLFRASSYEMPRSLNLPAEVYERNAKKVLPQYIKTMAKRIGDAEVFGPAYDKAANLVNKLHNVNRSEAGMMEKALQIHGGVYDQLHPTNPALLKAWDKFNAAEYGLKIGGGTATIPNIVQPIYSTIEEYGAGRFLKGAYKVITDPEMRRTVRKSGATDIDMMYAFVGDHPGGVWGRFADFTTKAIGFKQINKFNQYTAAATGKIFIETAMKAAKGTGRRAEWFRSRLNDLGIDYTKPLTEEQLGQKMFRIATDTQLQKKLTADPLFMSTPIGRRLSTLKRYSYRQYVYQKDLIMREVQRGNVMPVLRLAVGGYLGGEFVIWAKNLVQFTVSGRPVYRKEDQATWQRAVNNLAAIGSLGVFSDITGAFSDDSPAKTMVGKVAFAASPLIFQEGKKLQDKATLFAQDVDKYGLKTAIRRNAPTVTQFLGSLPSYLSKRFQTEQQKQDAIKNDKGQEHTAILDLFIEGKSDDAIRRIKLWNEHYPTSPFDGKDFSTKVFKQHQINKIKVQAGAK